MAFCKDCQKSSWYHLQTWLEDLTDHLLPFRFSNFLPKKFEKILDVLLEKFFVWSKLATLREDFVGSDIQPRSSCFIEEAKKQGIKFKALRGLFGYTNHFQMQLGKKIFRFEGLPLVEPRNQIVDDKIFVKKRLQKAGFPVAEGKSFWFWQKRKAKHFANQIGFPLIVKPRSGSLSQHVTTDIKSAEELQKAINKVICYSPTFIIEKFLPGASVFRATVIDFDNIFCVKQIPANVVGDGFSTIHQLIEAKNKNRHYKLVVDQNIQLSTVLAEGQIFYLQKDPFLRLGGDLQEVTAEVHPDNIQLFKDIAKFFDIRLVGIDFLAKDISLSWKSQPCAVLELNSLPNIEMHHFPSFGKPQNVAKTLLEATFKYL